MPDPVLKHVAPCRECPWRRASPAGWLGGFAPAEFVAIVHIEAPLGCHRTATRKQPALCAGALAYRANKGRPSPVAATDEVFAKAGDFLAHHQPLGDRVVCGSMFSDGYGVHAPRLAAAEVATDHEPSK